MNKDDDDEEEMVRIRMCSSVYDMKDHFYEFL